MRDVAQRRSHVLFVAHAAIASQDPIQRGCAMRDVAQRLSHVPFVAHASIANHDPDSVVVRDA